MTDIRHQTWLPMPDGGFAAVSVEQWAEYFVMPLRRRMATTVIRKWPHTVRVISEFTGLSAGLDNEGYPLTFQTTIFGGPFDGTVQHTSVPLEANMAHQHAVVTISSTGTLTWLILSLYRATRRFLAKLTESIRWMIFRRSCRSQARRGRPSSTS